MTNNNRQDFLDDQLAASLVDVEKARQGGSATELCRALSYLGLAQFRIRKYKDGLKAFEEAESLVADSGEPRLHARCLSMKVQAYEEAKRYHNAFETVNDILKIAEASGDTQMKCDALTTQAKILANSGEPMQGLEYLKLAHQIAVAEQDDRRLMYIYGAYGSLYIALSSLTEAADFFTKAQQYARNVGDTSTECGYLINQGTVLFWQSDYARAVQIFQQALAISEAISHPEMELSTLHYLAQALAKSNQLDDHMGYVQRGLTLAKQLNSPEIVFTFYELMLFDHTRKQQFDSMLTVLQEAVDYARKVGDEVKELELVMNLGETAMVHDYNEQALTAYTDAMTLAERIGKGKEHLLLVGRLGVVLAELGRTDEAIQRHQQAVDLAREHHLPAIEGEQLSMLAMAYFDQEQLDQAITACEDAIAVFEQGKIQDGAEKARQLYAELERAR